jgi:hypothetical protein
VLLFPKLPPFWKEELEVTSRGTNPLVNTADPIAKAPEVFAPRANWDAGDLLPAVDACNGVPCGQVR